MARICVIRQYYFPLDPRVRREVEALESDGHEVDVICLGKPGEPRREQRGSVTVRRLPLTHRRGHRFRYLYEYGVFLLAAGALVSLLHLRRRYDVVQVNSMPDALVFAALAPRLLGARVLLDLHECMPEFFATKFGKGLDDRAVRVIAWAEQASIRFADSAITCTNDMRDAFVSRGADPDGVEVILNGSDESVFDPERFPSTGYVSDGPVLICHGSVEEVYGLHTLIRAAALVKPDIPALRVEIYGDGTQVQELRDLATELAIEDSVYFSDGFVPLDDVVQAIAAADAGVVAMQRNAFRDLVLCNKMFDFISMRKPVISSRTRSVERYFDESCFLYFTSEDEHDLARAIRSLHAGSELGRRMVKRASDVAEPYRWPYQRRAYQAIVRRLAGQGRARSPRLVRPSADDEPRPAPERSR